jgi:membrane associated rhomboid family serine protease
MGLCCLAFLYSHLIVGADVSEIDERFQAVLQYYIYNPYLELDARLLRIMEDTMPPFEMEAFIHACRQRGNTGKPESPVGIAARQNELERKTQAFFESLDSHPTWRWGLIPAKFSFLKLVTSMFMHAGLLHLIGNLFFFYLCGPFIEDRWGRPLFAGFYMLGGFVAAALFAGLHMDSQIPLVGASGAIAACMGAFMILFWNIRIRFLFWFFFVFTGTFMAPAWLMLLLWFLREFVAAGLKNASGLGAGGGVAYLAHVFGFGFGMAAGYFLRAYRVRHPVKRSGRRSGIALVRYPVVQEARRLQEKGQPEKALRMVYDEALRDLTKWDIVSECWNMACEIKKSSAVIHVCVGLILAELQEGRVVQGESHWKQLLQMAPEVHNDMQVVCKVSESLLRAGKCGEAIDLLKGLLQKTAIDTPPSLIVKMIQLAKETGVPLPRNAAAAILNHPEIPRATKKKLEDRLYGAPTGTPGSCG